MNHVANEIIFGSINCQFSKTYFLFLLLDILKRAEVNAELEFVGFMLSFAGLRPPLLDVKFRNVNIKELSSS